MNYGLAWYVNFLYGDTYNYGFMGFILRDKSQLHRVRLVRAGP